MAQTIRKVVTIAPGARIEVRDAEWLVRRVETTSRGNRAIFVTGISEIVRDKEAVFLDDIEFSIKVLDPLETKLIADDSSGYEKAILFIENQLRRISPTDECIYVGDRAAMDTLPYQLDPALQALNEPRQRILIADAVGLGKTLEGGILVSELIKRGRGKRILVVTVKSMLTQFQKEWWTRFTIPLTRLDSAGIARIRQQIPANYNPFYYFDKTIISVDTLKSVEYGRYLETAYWDIIVIDEAQHVAERGTSSIRSKLAQRLSGRSDSLILLSATPHDGRPRSFASLMNMLDPTAIADWDNYGPEDIRGLFIRRFKKQVKDQIAKNFPDREMDKIFAPASPVEEEAFDFLSQLKLSRLDQKKRAGDLFKTVVEKSLFSSPVACIQTIDQRLKKDEGKGDMEIEKDLAKLRQLRAILERIKPNDFSKYQELLKLIKDPFKEKGFAWTGNDPKDRIVIFTERIETLKFLKANLPADLGLSKEQVDELHGGMGDKDQQEIVDRFGKEDSPVRILISSDVGAEGINLHFLSHRMIHFDIPWSLMTFQQRNGRIDRYGQEKKPQIRYMLNRTGQSRIRDDMRILEILIKKDDQAVKNIGDPSSFMGLFDHVEEERHTGSAMEQEQSPEEFEKNLDDTFARIEGDGSELFAFFANADPPVGNSAMEKRRRLPSLFANDYQYSKRALEYLARQKNWQVSFHDDKQLIELTMPEDLEHRYRFLPPEVLPNDRLLKLSSSTLLIDAEIKASRREEKAWPRVQYLWEQHPVLDWLGDKINTAFARHEAPVLLLNGILKPSQKLFILSGLIPNRKGNPVIHQWLAITLENGEVTTTEAIEKFLERTGAFNSRVPNPGFTVDENAYRKELEACIETTKCWMSEERKKFEETVYPKLNEHLTRLEETRDKHHRQLQLELDMTASPTNRFREEQERRRRQIDGKIDDYLKWVDDTMNTEDSPFIQLVAVLLGSV